MTPYGYIYLVRNSINGKVYVGQTTRTVDIRWKQHISDSVKRKHPFQCAIFKHGPDSFTVTTLHQAFDQKQLDDLEIREIAVYDATSPACGYNQRSGGSRGKQSAATRTKIGAANTNPSAERRARMRAAWKRICAAGRTRGMAGRRHSEATRAAMSASQTRDWTYNGRTMSAKQWAHELGLGVVSFNRRLRIWGVTDKTFTSPRTDTRRQKAN